MSFSQGFDLMNSQSISKVAESSLYTVTPSGIEEYTSTSVSKPFRITNNDTLFVGKEQTTTSVADGEHMPSASTLQQNYPNPFNNGTIIRYSVKEASDVSISVFDMAGREVKTLVKEAKQTGTFSVGMTNAEIASGTYIYRMITKSNSGKTSVETKKMIVLK